ncbi:hypothetical protein BKP56_07385 [Marinilactibacillus sp. 15R]|uniref:DNA repair exonuclease SbcCD nuclease subunit n=1 Tax=Marinilactibacillus piezotolerans TaxID=258723 RepID=A0A1I4AAT3_9LACT|nr:MULTISPECIES: DNA repair exonuclease [Marinilactibacillus]API89085.1 hypothetical protein BKP56_07385 [Marinilactibacillus sp. 15R]SFK53495.1 DNA repair exonuclease SbcCD nuclease subunit [Marinilactibacillus piezotolerans]
MVRFIHAADLHLDSPFSGLKDIPEKIMKSIQQSTFQSLSNLVYSAIHNQVDFVLFSGDIYDLEDRSVKAQVQFKQEMERLEKQNIPVYIIHGNHDFAGDETLHITLPANVTTFGTSVETVELTTNDGTVIALSGFSYDKRWITERMINQYPTRYNQVDFHIGLLHGFQEGQRSEHAHYAPFTVNELRKKKYDYWALGHIHTGEKISDFPPAYYPGNLQGRNKKESGEKGFLLVELNVHTSAEIKFFPSAPIIWQKVNIDATKIRTVDAYYKLIQESLPTRENKYSYLVTLDVLVSKESTESFLNKITQNQFIEIHQHLNDKEFLWITEYKVTPVADQDERLDINTLFPEAWGKVLAEVSEDKVFNELTADFFEQSKSAYLMQERTEFYRQEMIKKAILELQMISDTKGVENSED